MRNLSGLLLSNLHTSTWLVLEVLAKCLLAEYVSFLKEKKVVALVEIKKETFHCCVVYILNIPMPTGPLISK